MLDEHGRLTRRRRLKASSQVRPGEADSAPAVAERSVARYADPRFWHAVARKRRLAAAGVAAAFVALIALLALAWTAFVWPGARGDSTETGAPAGRTPASTIASTPASMPVSSVPSSVSPGADATASPGSQPVAGYRAPLVPFRREGAVWVVNESGGSARRVVTSASGPYSLSPDGARLAIVDGVSGRLSIVDVDTGARKDVGPAAAVRPDWSPDSQWLLYSRSAGADQDILRVAAGGYGQTVLMRGAGGRFVSGPDVAIAAPRASTLPSQLVANFSDGRVVRISNRAFSVEVCPAPRGLYFVDSGGGVSAPSIHFVSFEGGSELTVVPSPEAGAQVSLGDLSVSPDGRWFVYAETRDDGYSRMFSRQATGIKVIPLKTHRDSYLVGWSADGSEILRIEGNATQGEATRLTALHPDGTGWRVVAEGAGL